MDSLDTIFGKPGVFQPTQAPAANATANPNGRPSLDSIFKGTTGQTTKQTAAAAAVAANPSQHVYNPALPGGAQAAADITKGSSPSVIANLPAGTKDALGNMIVKPFAETTVSGYNAGVAFNDAVTGKSDKIIKDLKQPRELPIIGKTPPLSTEHPFVAGAEAGFSMAGTADAARAVPELLSKLPEVASKFDARMGGEATQKALTQTDSQAVNKLQEVIAPKITSKETQAIINEGRLTRGNDSLLFGKQPDIVTQSDSVKQAAQVIHDTIPNAAKLNDAQLSTALDTTITETAQNLKPVMESTPVRIDTTGKVQDAWTTLKAEQQARPEFFDNHAGNAAFQSKFQNYLKQLHWDITNPSTGKFQTPTPKTMDDIWEVRKAYDASIPDNVKNATSQSSPVLQDRKTMWLENRAILNSAINDTATGLGDASKQAFSDMSHLYEARQNIASKAKIDTKGTPGPLSKSTLLKWGLGTGITYLIGRDIIKH